VQEALPVQRIRGRSRNSSVSREFDTNFWVMSRSVNGRGIDFAYDDDGLLTQAGSLGLSRDPWDSAALRVQGIRGRSRNSLSFDGPLLTQSQWSGAVNATVSREFGANFCARIVSGPAFCAGAYVANGNGVEHTGPNGTTTAAIFRRMLYHRSVCLISDDFAQEKTGWLWCEIDCFRNSRDRHDGIQDWPEGYKFLVLAVP